MAQQPALRGARQHVQAWLGESDRLVTGLADGLTLTVPSKYARRYFRADYEGRAMAFLTESLQPGMTAVDVGAHVGFVTCLLGRLVGPEGLVIAVEPFEGNAALVRRNVEQNGLTARVLEAGAGATTGYRSLQITGSSDSHSFYEHPNTATVRTMEVQQLALDDVITERPHLVKIDTEGAELEVLAGMSRLLREHQPRLLVEWAPRCQVAAGHQPRELIDVLHDLGYEMSVLDVVNDSVLTVDEAISGLDERLASPWYADLACVPRR